MFTALANNLMGVGFSWPQAQMLGYSINRATAAGTTQGAGTVIAKGGNQIVFVTTASGQTAVTIDSGVPVGGGVLISCDPTTIYPASIFPPTGCTIDVLSANAAITLNGNEAVYVVRTSTTVFEMFRFPMSGPIQTTATCTGTTQGAGVLLYGNRSYLLTTSAGQTAATINGEGVEIGNMLEAWNTTATTALLFPPSGCTIDNGSADASVNIAQNKGRIIRRTGATTFHTILSA